MTTEEILADIPAYLDTPEGQRVSDIVRCRTLEELVKQVSVELEPGEYEIAVLMADALAEILSRGRRPVSMSALLICVSSAELEAEVRRQE